MKASAAGKGDNIRPLDWREYEKNFDEIDWGNEPNVFDKPKRQESTLPTGDLTRKIRSENLGFNDYELPAMQYDLKKSGVKGVEFERDKDFGGHVSPVFNSPGARDAYAKHRGMHFQNHTVSAGLSKDELEIAEKKMKDKYDAEQSNDIYINGVKVDTSVPSGGFFLLKSTDCDDYADCTKVNDPLLSMNDNRDNCAMKTQDSNVKEHADNGEEKGGVGRHGS